MKKTMERLVTGEQIKAALVKLSNTDGLKRTQRWLANRISMGEVELSNKIAKDDFTETDLEKINEVLSTEIK